MRIDIRVHTDHITTDDLAVFAALAALTPGTTASTPTKLHAVKETSEVAPAPAPKTAPARPAARKAPAAKPAPEPAPTQEPEEAAAPVAAEPTETKLAAAKRELTEEVTKLARSGPEGRARAKKALIGAGVERVSEVKTLTVAKAVLAALAEGDEADDLA
jgi:outer membrane biosynthesis protein TonB